MNLFSEMATLWLRAAAAQMQYWQDAADKWQETASKMTGMMPKVDLPPSRFKPEMFNTTLLKKVEAEMPVGAWPMPVKGAPKPAPADADPGNEPVAPPKKAPASAKPATKARVAPSGPSSAPQARAPQDSGIPPLLDTPPAVPDDLLRLKGVGPKILKLLNDLGIYTFAQIAAWTPEQIAWIEGKLDFKGRVTREGWVTQAQTLLDPVEAKMQ